MVLFANIDFRDVVGPGFGAKAAAQLEADVKAGAMGLEDLQGPRHVVRKADGTRLQVDDPELDPVWETCARLNIPVLIHTAEPAEFFEPLDYNNERWLELALYPDRRYPAGRVPAFEAADGRARSPVREAPEDDVHRGALRLARQRPGAARRRCSTRCRTSTPRSAPSSYDLGRQPRAAHEFFVKYQDRMLFGKDSYQPDEYPYYWRVVRDQRRVLRLLPRLPRVLEAVRHRICPTGAARSSTTGTRCRLMPGLPRDRLSAD